MSEIEPLAYFHSFHSPCPGKGYLLKACSFFDPKSVCDEPQHFSELFAWCYTFLLKKDD